MIVNTKCADFKEENFYIGIDTHKRNWKVTVRTRDIELKTFSSEPLPEKLSNYMRHNYPNGRYHSVYEAGFCGYWIHRSLTALQFNNIIVNPSDVPSTNKERNSKSDPIDSRKLSRELANRSLRGIYIPTQNQEALRCIHRNYKRKTRRLTQVKNQIKGLLCFCGIQLPQEYEGRCWSNKFIQYLSDLQMPSIEVKTVLGDQVEEFKHAKRSKLKSLKQIRDISKDIPLVRNLKTIPGVGILTAFALFTELINMKRFRNLDHLASYVGLVPSVQSSDTTVVVKGISFRHNKYLRSSLIESAWVAIRSDPALLSAYNELTKRMKGNEAIVRIAKKLLNRIRYVWLNECEYVQGLVSTEKVKA